jgi:RNA polymerase sigma-70 factor (ECF subfamily)
MSISAAGYFPGILGKETEPRSADAEPNGSLSPESGREQSPAPESPSPTDTSLVCARTSTPVEPSDEALMAGVGEGDKEALALLFRRYARIVRGVAYRVLRDPSEADDLLQDIFLIIHNECSKFDSSRGPARFWILQMTYRRALSRRRYLNTRHFYTRSDLEEVERTHSARGDDGGRSPESVDGVLGDGALERMFNTLSQDQRRTLTLFFFEGYTLEEIARKLDQTRGNVKHHYFRGLEKLRRQVFGNRLQDK